MGAEAVAANEVVVGVDVLILSVPLSALPGIAPTVVGAPGDTIVIDTSNYYPGRDGRIDALEDGQVESLWVSQQLGRPVVKVWNAIGSDSLATKGAPAGSPDPRAAITQFPVFRISLGIGRRER